MGRATWCEFYKPGRCRVTAAAAATSRSQDYDDLCGVFGVTSRTIGAYLEDVEPLILHAMRTTFAAEVMPVMANGAMPTHETIAAWGHAVEHVYGPCPANTAEERFFVWGAMDCMRLALPTPSDYDLERP